MMQPRVFGFRQNHQVLWPVVRLVAVDVMNIFVWLKWATDRGFSDKHVSKNVTAGTGAMVTAAQNQHAAVLAPCLSALPVVVFGAARKALGPVFVPIGEALKATTSRALNWFTATTLTRRAPAWNAACCGGAFHEGETSLFCNTATTGRVTGTEITAVRDGLFAALAPAQPSLFTTRINGRHSNHGQSSACLPEHVDDGRHTRNFTKEMVLIDPSDEEALARWEQLQRAHQRARSWTW